MCLRERDRVCVRERGRVCVRERERKREGESVCVREREGESVCVFQRAGGREKAVTGPEEEEDGHGWDVQYVSGADEGGGMGGWGDGGSLGALQRDDQAHASQLRANCVSVRGR